MPESKNPDKCHETLPKDLRVAFDVAGQLELMKRVAVALKDTLSEVQITEYPEAILDDTGKQSFDNSGFDSRQLTEIECAMRNIISGLIDRSISESGIGDTIAPGIK